MRWFRHAPGARPLVLVHGFTGATSSWASVGDALAGAETVVAVPLPGHDPAVAVVPGFEANTDRLAGAIDAAGLAGCHLVGYSLGGRTALSMAVRHPRLFAALTLIGANPGIVDAAARRARVEDDQAWIDLLLQRGLGAFLDAWQALPLFTTQARLPATVQAEQRRQREQHDPTALARSLQHMGLGAMPDYWGALATLPMPVSWLAGALDSKYAALAREGAERMRAAGRVARFATIPNSGHNPVLEQPAALAAALSVPVTD
ncbi:alpha/beta fold hydrolase [Haliangium sp.]|uniref:alpha/beta fold hydrolase n=1 Tax=Haliangium sp. TaxID=2663208 RepID=UPI003D0BB8F2